MNYLKTKALNMGVVLASLIGRMEWGQNNQAFLYEAEWEVLSKLFVDPLSVAHPFTFIPILGQIVLIITLFQRKPGRVYSLGGFIAIAILMAMILLVGFLSLNYKIILSTIPFIAMGVLSIRHHRRKNEDI